MVFSFRFFVKIAQNCPEVQIEFGACRREHVLSLQDLTAAGYGAAILLTVLFVGVNARYYARRALMLEKYLAETPAWVVELQRSARVD